MTTLAVVAALVAGLLLWGWIAAGPSTRRETLHDVTVEAVDGDTLRLEGLDRTIRLARVDAPEKGEPGAEAATKAVREALEEAEHVKVVSAERGKWDRWIAEVEADGRNLSDLLLDRGLADRY